MSVSQLRNNFTQTPQVKYFFGVDDSASESSADTSTDDSDTNEKTINTHGKANRLKHLYSVQDNTEFLFTERQNTSREERERRGGMSELRKIKY